MPEGSDSSLRKTIYNRMSEREGCYVFVYLNLEEKLSFLSYFLEGIERSSPTARLLVDFNLRKYAARFNVKNCTLIGNSPEIRGRLLSGSTCLRAIRDEIDRIRSHDDASGHVNAVIDVSSVLSMQKKISEDKVSSFHRELVGFIRSTNDLTAVLLYDANFLTESLMMKLISFDQSSTCSPKTSSPQKLKDAFLQIEGGRYSPEIIAMPEGIVFLDPPSGSAALLVPNTEVIKRALPYDPLSVTHSDIAFADNYTAYEGACPYSCREAPSGCLLDPKVIRVVRFQGRSFVEGHRCSTATDHMICKEEPGGDKNGDEDGSTKSNSDRESQKCSSPQRPT